MAEDCIGGRLDPSTSTATGSLQRSTAALEFKFLALGNSLEVLVFLAWIKDQRGDTKNIP